MTTEYIGGSVKYHNVCSILYSMSLMITVQYLSVFCAEGICCVTSPHTSCSVVSDFVNN